MATTIDRYKLIIDTQGATGNINSLMGSLRGLGPLIAGAFVVTGIVQFGQKILEVGRRFETMRNQLRLVTTSTAELQQVFGQLQEVSARTFTSIDDTVELFSKLKLSTEALGKSTEDVITVTQKFQQALALSGADANTASAAIRQFGQAMASGTVRGDEFTSIVEALGPALAIMARESGLTVGELRNLSKEGELTAEAFFEMVKASEAIEQAFASLRVTTAQVETNLGGTFDEVVNKIDEALGITSTYRGVLLQLNRDLADLFNTSQSLENVSLAEIFKLVETNALNADIAIAELNGRIADGIRFSTGYGLFNADERQRIIDMRDAIVELQRAREEENRVRQEQAEADLAELRRIEALSAPYTALADQLESVAKAHERALPKVEQLRIEYNNMQELLTTLQGMRGTEIEQHNNVSGAIELVTNRMSQLRAEMEEAQKTNTETGATFEKFYDSVIKRAQETVQETGFVQEAIAQLNSSSLASDAPQVYAEAMRYLQDQLRDTASETDALTDKLENFFSSAEERIARARNQLELAGLTGLDRDLARIRQEEDGILASMIAQVEASDRTRAEKDEIIARLRTETAETTRLRQEIERTTDSVAEQTSRRQREAQEAAKRAQQTFANGWRDAYQSYADSANNAFTTAQNLFRQTTRGMEDLLVNFVKTGKFEWKTFVQDITETLLRSQIRSLISDVFGGGSGTTGGSGGGGGNIIGNLLGGLFGGNSGSGNTNPVNDMLGGLFGGSGGTGGGISGIANGTANNPFYVIPVGGSGLGRGSTTNGPYTNPYPNPSLNPFSSNPAAFLTASGKTSSNNGPFDLRGYSPFETLVKQRFAGMFADGGYIPAGSFGITGERGPEFVSGPANITPMGNSNVTYNINAVDARSFKELVAQDPAFIHSVAQLGGSNIPRRRR